MLSFLKINALVQAWHRVLFGLELPCKSLQALDVVNHERLLNEVKIGIVFPVSILLEVFLKFEVGISFL